MTTWVPTLTENHDPLYLAIAKALVTDASEGRLRPGDRLPTQRELARRLGVSIGTVTRAYLEAERRGVISGETGRGTFVRNLEPEGATGTATWRQVSGGVGKGDIIDLSVSYPIDTEAPDLAAGLRAVAERSDVLQLLRYESHHVRERHVEAGAKWLRYFGLAARPEEVVVTVGAHHAFGVILGAIAKPGDLVLVDEHAFSGFVASAQQQHLRLQGVAMDEFGMIPDALHAACRQRKARALFLTPTIHNPTTAVMTAERREKIAEVAEQHDLLIIEDEAIRFLSPDAPPPVATLVPERTFFIATMSKAIGGGLRVAFVAAPPFAREQLKHGVWSSVWMAAPLNLEIATLWIEDGTAADVAQRKRREAEARQQITREVLAGFDYRTQPAAYFIWLYLPLDWSSAEFANEARRRGVAVTPSGAFTLRSGEPPKAVRVCVSAAEDRAQLRKGLSLIAELAHCRACCPSALV
jgi:DNA-binding transcriptional MocR family regulator